jgi:molybdopterin adenylyltransferase
MSNSETNPPGSPSSIQHKHLAIERGTISISVITVSDSRTAETDTNFQYLQKAIEKAGHKISGYQIIKDEADQVVAVLQKTVSEGKSQVMLFNGGTGISRRDTTFDVLNRYLEKTIPGFGEIFRQISYQQIGSAAMLSRATAGIYHGLVIISTPGSPAAVSLAWEKLIEPELQHMVWEVTR